eukprot:gene6481-8914_t
MKAFHLQPLTPIKHSSSKLNLSMRWGLKAQGSPNKPTGDLPDGVTLRDTVPFELRGFSLPLVVFSVGFLLTASSFAGFFLNDGGSDGAVSSLGFVYGIPVFLIGLSLWYAEIPPVEVVSSSSGDLAWEKYANDTFQKVKKDVTRHRYGDDAHLDSTLEALGLKLPQKKFPKLLSLTQESVRDNTQLSLTLTFQSAETPYKIWAEPQRIKKYAKFFGPNLISEVLKVDSDKRIVAIKLTTVPEEEYVEFLNKPIIEVKEEEEESNISSTISNEFDGSKQANV